MSNDAAVPTAEDKARYEQLKKDLMQALHKKRAADKALAQIETQIYTMEGTYLTETSAQSGGNVIQGFENYLKTQTGGRRRHEISDADRIFSNSSLTYQKSLEFFGEGEESTPTNDDLAKQLTPGLTTVIVPAATKKQEQSAAQAKRERDREYQRKKRANGNQRNADVPSDEEATPTGRRGTKRARGVDDD